MVDKALAAADEQTVALPAEIITTPLITQVARQLLELDREIKDLDKHITERFGQHPHAGPITRRPRVRAKPCSRPAEIF